mgnify:FL=1
MAVDGSVIENLRPNQQTSTKKREKHAEKRFSSQVNNRNNKLTNLKVIVFLLNEFVSDFVQAELKPFKTQKSVFRVAIFLAL